MNRKRAKVNAAETPLARNALRRYVDEVNDVTSAGDIFLHAQIWGFGVKKTRVRSKFSTYKIGYRQNFVKNRKLILFGPKCRNLEIQA